MYSKFIGEELRIVWLLIMGVPNATHLKLHRSQYHITYHRFYFVEIVYWFWRDWCHKMKMILSNFIQFVCAGLCCAVLCTRVYVLIHISRKTCMHASKHTTQIDETTSSYTKSQDACTKHINSVLNIKWQFHLLQTCKICYFFH